MNYSPELIQNKRLEYGATHAELAQALEVSERLVKAWEAPLGMVSSRIPNAVQLGALAEALHCSVASFYAERRTEDVPAALKSMVFASALNDSTDATYAADEDYSYCRTAHWVDGDWEVVYERGPRSNLTGNGALDGGTFEVRRSAQWESLDAD